MNAVKRFPRVGWEVIEEKKSGRFRCRGSGCVRRRGRKLWEFKSQLKLGLFFHELPQVSSTPPCGGT